MLPYVDVIAIYVSQPGTADQIISVSKKYRSKKMSIKSHPVSSHNWFYSGFGLLAPNRYALQEVDSGVCPSME